ncbi:MAG: four helix bundle protein, partial [Candidatus Magasanikiibacteriota bacterium]
MNNELGKIKKFTDLNAWKEGHKLVLQIYEITRNFSKEELFILVSQMKRCDVSITSNIAEGFGRQSYKEKIQFYFIALGSVTELQNQLLISKDVG